MSPTRFIPLCAVLLAAHAQAAKKENCDSCASCTERLAVDGARVTLTTDLSLSGGACVTVAGQGADFNGDGHSMLAEASPAGTAIRIVGADALVRRLEIDGADIGVEVAGARDATLLKLKIRNSDVGVSIDDAPGARLRRGAVEGGRIGVALGAPGADGRCPPGARVTSPSAVVQMMSVSGAKIGLAACEALPVLTANTIRDNEVGLLLGAPKAGRGSGGAAPHDPCVCAPPLDGVGPGTTLFYSSGCGGCQVHEGWLPQIRSAGHDIRLRETGKENVAETDRFDALVRRCAPEITDAIGTRGCVPNYACLANEQVFKRIGDNGQLIRDHRLDNASAVGEFAGDCAKAAKARFGGGAGCIRDALWDNTVCGNREADIRAAKGSTRHGGRGNACAKADGWKDRDAAACTRSCAELPASEADR